VFFSSFRSRRSIVRGPRLVALIALSLFASIVICEGIAVARPHSGSTAQGQAKKKHHEYGVIRLHHERHATKIAAALKDFIDVEIRVPSADTLIVYGDHQQIDNVKALVASLDQPRSQISIQAWSVRLGARHGERDQLTLDWSHEQLRSLVDEISADMQGAIWRATACAQSILRVQMGLSTAPQTLRPSDERNQFFEPVESVFKKCAEVAERRWKRDGNGKRTNPRPNEQNRSIRAYRAYLTTLDTDEGRETAYGLAWNDRMADDGVGLGYRDIFRPSRASLVNLLVMISAIEDLDDVADLIVAAMRTGLICSSAPLKTLDLVSVAKPSKDVTGPLDGDLAFQRFANALESVSAYDGGPRLRSALASYLFNYKWSVLHPMEVVGYDLGRSADELDALLAYFAREFQSDVATYTGALMRTPKPMSCVTRSRVELIRENSESPIQKIAGWMGHGKKLDPAEVELMEGFKSYDDKINYAFRSSASVTTLSAQQASVSGKTTQFFEISKLPGLGDVLKAAKKAIEEDDEEDDDGDGADLLELFKDDPRKIAVEMALEIAKAAADKQNKVVEIGGGLSLNVGAVSLASGANAELDVVFEYGEDAPPKIRGTENETEPLDRVRNHKVDTTVRVENLRLFEISGLATQGQMFANKCDIKGFWDWALGRPVKRCPYPIVGHAADLVFGMIPVLKDVIYKPLSHNVENDSKISISSAIIGALIVPTSVDLATGQRFSRERWADGRPVWYDNLSRPENHARLKECRSKKPAKIARDKKLKEICDLMKRKRRVVCEHKTMVRWLLDPFGLNRESALAACRPDSKTRADR